MFTKLQEKSAQLANKALSCFSAKDIVRINQFMTTSAVAFNFMAMSTLASGSGNVNMSAMFGSLIAMVCDIFFYIGAILLVWAIGQLVLAFKNEDADSKSRAVMVLVCAVLLLSVKTIYNAIVDSSGAGVQATTSPIT